MTAQKAADHGQLLFISYFLLCLYLANGLGHSAHGAEAAPHAGFEQGVYRKTDDGGGEHKAIKTEAEICHPVCHGAGGIGPSPRHTKQPKQLYRLFKVTRARCHQPGLEYHTAKHGKEEHKECVSEPFGGYPFGGRLLS